MSNGNLTYLLLVDVGEQVENLKMNILQAIQYNTKAWEEITAETIRHCWYQNSSIVMGTDLRNLADNIRATEDSISDELCKAFDIGSKLGSCTRILNSARKCK